MSALQRWSCVPLLCVAESDQSKSIPKRRSASASTAKQITEMATHASKVGQKPMRANSAGNARNIGKVGSTYQKVYFA